MVCECRRMMTIRHCIVFTCARSLAPAFVSGVKKLRAQAQQAFVPACGMQMMFADDWMPCMLLCGTPARHCDSKLEGRKPVGQALGRSGFQIRSVKLPARLPHRLSVTRPRLDGNRHRPRSFGAEHPFPTEKAGPARRLASNPGASLPSPF